MAGRGRLTPYQSEDPSHTLPTYRGKEEKGKIVEDIKGDSNEANKKALDLLLKPANPTPSNTESTRSFQRVTEREKKSCGTERFCSVEAHKYTDVIHFVYASTVCNPDLHIRHRLSATKWVPWVTPNLVQHTQHCHRSTMEKDYS